MSLAPGSLRRKVEGSGGTLVEPGGPGRHLEAEELGIERLVFPPAAEVELHQAAVALADFNAEHLEGVVQVEPDFLEGLLLGFGEAPKV